MSKMTGEAFRQLYDAFAHYQQPEKLNVCPCCVDIKVAEKLCQVPLSHISKAQMSDYSFCALTTCGDLDDFRYFLPRMLELGCQDNPSWDFEIILSKIGYGDFHSWPEPEQHAIRRWVQAMWVSHIHDGAIDKADTLLCGAASFMDITPLLREADAIDPDFRHQYRDECTNSRKYRLTNTFWRRKNPMHDLVIRWAYGDDTALSAQS